MKISGLILSFFLIFAFSVEARLITIYSPEDLVRSSEIVCNGIPKEIKISNEPGPFSRYATILVKARIQVIGKYKGEIPAEFILSYPIIDWKATKQIIDGPCSIDLKVNQRYRFYLKAQDEKTGFYPTAIKGSDDERSAVEALDVSESDDSPPFLKDEALQEAKKFVYEIRPGYVPDETKTEALYRNFTKLPSWDIQFYSKEPKHYPLGTSDVHIVINRSGFPEKQSFIAGDVPKSGTSDLASLMEKNVRMTLNKNKKGNILICSGLLKKITDDYVEGVFAIEWGHEPPKTIQIPRRDIEGIQEVLW